MATPIGIGGGFELECLALLVRNTHLAPRRTDALRIAVQGNGYAGTMSADAAGIVATLFALNHLAAEPAAERFIDLYYLLRDFAAEHSERGAIFAAID